MNSHRFYIITGASGAGKSTLLEALRGRGYSVVTEAARAVMQEQLARESNILPAADREAFMEAVLVRSLQDYETAKALRPPVFFDRAIPEWLRFLGSDAKNRHIPATQCRYASTVFLTEPWQEIYVQDNERVASFEKAARSYAPTVSAYIEFGYSTCVIPKLSVQERAVFILDKIESSKLS